MKLAYVGPADFFRYGGEFGNEIEVARGVPFDIDDADGQAIMDTMGDRVVVFTGEVADAIDLSIGDVANTVDEVVSTVEQATE